MRVLGISGSLRRDSYNTMLLQTAGELFDAEGVDFVTYDELKSVPPYDEDDEASVPEAAARLREAVAGSDAVFFVTPEYNSSIPGQLKNAVDWLSRPTLADAALRNKPAAVIGASTGMFGAVWAQAELRKVLGAAGARVVEGEVPVGHAQSRFVNGRLDDHGVIDQIRELVQRLIAQAEPAYERDLAA